MKNKILSLLVMSFIATTMFTACAGNAATDAEVDADVTETVVEEAVEATEEHGHEYAKNITVEPTCETDGEVTFTCNCGDAYTEVIPATGHTFENYVSNNDATYEADGTETAKCSTCDATDTRVDEGSMLAYTYTDMNATKYAKSTVNVRNMPTTDGEKLGGLSLNDDVKVTGQCNETGWYRIEYSGDVAYVSNSYLVDNKIEVQTVAETQPEAQPQPETPAETPQPEPQPETPAESSSDFPYELFTVYDNGSIAWYYTTEAYGHASDAHWNATHACISRNHEFYPNGWQDFEAAVAAAGGSYGFIPTSYYVDGKRVYQSFAY